MSVTFSFLFLWWDWGLNSGLCACKAGVAFEPHLPPVHLALIILGMGVLRTICSGWPRGLIFPISASQVASITDVHHTS
jgi:hypothetical protein